MERPKFGARLALVSLVGIVSLLVPASAGATFLPGPNGDLVFTSGRAPQNDDNNARIWRFEYPNGPATQVTTLPLTSQHRHPSWSPDHTKIAYAAGVGFSGTYALWIKDLVLGSSAEFVPAAAGQDRPSWSPDGTKIAYGSGGDIWVKGIAPGSIAQQLTTSADAEERPVWSPDSSFIIYNRAVAGNARDLYKKSPVTPAGTETPLVAGATDDWQPAISPNGSKVCFLRGPQNDNADLWTANTSAPASPVEFSNHPTLGNLNCVYSPDGAKIAYTQGAFGAGQLVEKNINGGDFRVLSQDAATSVYFDGNGDWAQNTPPTCANAGPFDVAFNSFLSVTLPECTDPEGQDVDRDIVAEPTHGNRGALDNGSVIYTPNANFSGADSFTFKGNDGTSDSNTATISLNVAGKAVNNGKDVTAAKIDAVVVSPKTWRRGPNLPSVLSRTALGTTIAYRLSEKARVTLTFARKTSGRRVRGRCRKRTRKNRKRRRCTRYVTAGRLSFDGKAGTNRLKFQGRLTRRKRLAIGRYRLTIGGKDAAGNASKRTSPVLFKIVRR